MRGSSVSIVPICRRTGPWFLVRHSSFVTSVAGTGAALLAIAVARSVLSAAGQALRLRPTTAAVHARSNSSTSKWDWLKFIERPHAYSDETGNSCDSRLRRSWTCRRDIRASGENFDQYTRTPVAWCWIVVCIFENFQSVLIEDTDNTFKITAKIMYYTYIDPLFVGFDGRLWDLKTALFRCPHGATISNPACFPAVKQVIFLGQRAAKRTFLIDLDVTNPLSVSFSPRNEELRL